MMMLMTMIISLRYSATKYIKDTFVCIYVYLYKHLQMENKNINRGGKQTIHWHNWMNGVSNGELKFMTTVWQVVDKSKKFKNKQIKNKEMLWLYGDSM